MTTIADQANEITTAAAKALPAEVVAAFASDQAGARGRRRPRRSGVRRRHRSRRSRCPTRPATPERSTSSPPTGQP